MFLYWDVMNESSASPRTTEFDPESLILSFQAGVWRYLRSIGCESSLAQDLTQETFLRVLQKPFEVYDDAATASYLRRVAHNLFISYQRRESKKIAVPDFELFEKEWSYWVRDDQGAELLLTLKSCYSILSKRAKLALRMRFEQKLQRKTIAEHLDITEHGAKNLMQRAKKKLRQCIERKLNETR